MLASRFWNPAAIVGDCCSVVSLPLVVSKSTLSCIWEMVELPLHSAEEPPAEVLLPDFADGYTLLSALMSPTPRIFVGSLFLSRVTGDVPRELHLESQKGEAWEGCDSKLLALPLLT